MRTVFLFIYLFFIHNVLSSSPIKVKGTIYENNTETPIEFANIVVKSTNNGTISNSEGKFELLIYKIPDTLLISCIGYMSKKIAITNNYEELIIKLEKQFYSISEVNVKPKPAVELVKEAIEAIKTNYINIPYSFKAHYRNIFRQNGYSVRLTEAICSFYQNGYALEGIDPMENSFYRNRFRNYDGYGIYRYFDSHIDPKDKVKIIALRKSYDFSRQITKSYVTGGPMGILAYDKVKYKNEFLDINKLKYYNFKIDSVLFFEGKEVYRISFGPNKRKKLKTDDYRKKRYARKYYAAEFAGKLYIDTYTKAILRISYQIVKIKKHTIPFPLKIVLNYTSIGNKYFLYSAKCEKQVELRTGIKGNKFDDFNFVTTLLVDKNIEIDKPTKIKDKDNFVFSRGNALYKLNKTYNHRIWKQYNTIVPNNQEKKMMSELEEKIPLSIQFKYPDKITENLFTKEAFKSDYLYSIAHNVKSESYFNKYDTLTQKILSNYGYRSKKRKKHRTLKIGEYYEDESESSDYPVVKKTLGDEQSKLIFNTSICQKKFPKLEYEDFSVSPDENYIIIYLTDENADVSSHIKIFNLKTRELVNSLAQMRNLAWINDSTIVYSQHDTLSGKGKFVYYTSLKSFNNQKLIYTENDPYMESDVYLLDSNYFVVHSLGHGYDELRVSSTKNIKLKLVSQKQDNVFYSTKRIAGETYILKRSQKKWDLCSYSYFKNKLQPIKILDKNIWVRSFEVTNKYFVLSILENSFSKIVFIPKSNTDSVFYADSINPLADNFIKINNYKDDIITVYEFNVPNTYEKISIDLNRQSYEKEPIKYLKNTSEYECKRLWAVSNDKVKIPITIIYKKGLILKNIPVVLEAYGSYGINTFPQSNQFIIPLLEEGIAYATAHVRGSSYKGIQWYLDGKLKNKPNGIDDLITCSEFLVKGGITNEKQLCLYARSAGGLIVGAAVNKNPKLCKAVVYDKANVDLISRMAQNDFGSKYHYFEYGTPTNKKEYEVIKTYSPLQNLPKQYPHTYMIIGLNDKMVNPKSNLNFLRKLDKIDNGSHTILAKIYENEGHQGSLDKQTNLFRTALMYTFIINEIKSKRESRNPE